MSGNGQKVGSIYVALGVDVEGLNKQITAAKERLDAFGYKGKPREITFSVKINPSTASVEAAGKKLKDTLGKTLVLTPTISAASAKNFSAGLVKQVGLTTLPVKLHVAGGARAAGLQIAKDVGVIKIPVELVYRGGGRPGGAAGGASPAGGGGTSGGGAGSQTAVRHQRAQERIAKSSEVAATQAEANVRQGRPAGQTRAERSAANKAEFARLRDARAQERIASASEAQAKTAIAAVNATRPRTVKAATVTASGGAATSGVATSGAARGGFACPECGKAFTSEGSLTGHIRGTHNRQRAQAVRAAGGSTQDVRTAAHQAAAARDAGMSIPPPVITGAPSTRPSADSPARASRAQRRAEREALRAPVTTTRVAGGGGVGTATGTAGDRTTFAPDVVQRQVADRSLNARAMSLSPEEEAARQAHMALPRKADRGGRGLGRRSSTRDINLLTEVGQGVKGVKLGPIGQVPEAHRQQAELARMGPGGILAQLQTSRYGEMLAADQSPRATQVREALADVRDDGSFTKLSAMDQPMSDALFAHMSGDYPAAKALSSEWEGGGIEGSFYTYGGDPAKAAKRLKRLRRAQIGKTDPYSLDPAMLLRAGFANAIRGDITSQETPTSRNRKASAKGNAGTRSTGAVAIQQSAAESNAALKRQQAQRDRLEEQALPSAEDLKGELGNIQAQPVNLPGVGSYYAAAPLEEEDPEKAQKFRDSRREPPKRINKPSPGQPSGFAGQSSGPIQTAAIAQRDTEMEYRLAHPQQVAQRAPTEAELAAQAKAQQLTEQVGQRKQNWAGLSQNQRNWMLRLGGEGAPIPSASLGGVDPSMHIADLVKKHNLPQTHDLRSSENERILKEAKKAAAAGTTGSFPEPPAIFRRAAGGPVKAGFLSRPFGASSGAPEGHVNVARENGSAWKKLRSGQLRSQPWCSHCGIGRLEATQKRNFLTADHITSQAHGGDPWDPQNLQTLCTSCNSRKGYQSGSHGAWDKPRPRGIMQDSRLKATTHDLLPGGRFFNVGGIRDAMKRRAGGGPVQGGPMGGLLGRILQSTLYQGGAIRPGDERKSQYYNALVGIMQGGSPQSGGAVREDMEPPPGSAAADRLLAYRQGRAGGGPVWKDRLRTTDYTAQVRGPGADLHPSSWLTAKRLGLSKQTYLVGEVGEEMYVGKSGQAEMVGQHGPEVRGFPEDGQIIPHHQLGGMSRRVAGGPVGNQGGNLWYMGDANRRRIAAGTAHGTSLLRGTSMSIAQNAQPVRVVNWPNAFSNPQQLAGMFSGGGAAGSPRVPRANAPAAGMPRATAGTAGPAAAGAGAAAAAAGPVAGGRLVRPPRTGAVSRIKGREQAFQSVDALREDLDKINTGISEALQLSPVRAASVAFGQISQTLVGGRKGILERAGRARSLQQRATRATSMAAAEEEKLTTIREQSALIRRGTVGPGRQDMFKTDTEKLETRQQNVADYLAQRKATADQRRIATERTDTARVAQKGILSPVQAVRAQGAGLAGIIGGTVLFTAAMTAVQVALELVGKAAGPAADAFTGFAGTAARVTSELGAQVQARGGDVRGTVAAAAGAAGLPGGFNTAGIETMAGREAGNKNLQTAIDLIRAGRRVDRGGPEGGNHQVGIGIGMGNGVLPGTPFNWLGQTPGAVEQTAGLFNPANPEANSVGAIPNNVQKLFQIAGENLGGSDQATKNANILKLVDESRHATTGDASGPADIIDTVKVFNETVTKAGSEFGKLVYDPTKTKEIEQTYKAMIAAGVAGPIADKYRQAGISAQTGTGATVSSARDINNLFEGQLKGQNIQDPGYLLQSMQRGLQAQIHALESQAALARTTTIPTSFAENLAVNPLASKASVAQSAVGSQTLGALGPQFSAVDPTVTMSVKTYASATNDARKELQALQAIGDKAWADLKVPPDQIAAIKSLGNEIRDLKERAGKETGGLAQAQYNRDLMLQKRSLGDALAMEGKRSTIVRALVGFTEKGTARYQDQVVVATKLGQLQKEQLLSSREADRIQLAMSQRQLNFSRAVSRLSTPGATATERASRARDADYEAKQQQRLLDINKKQFGTGIQIQKIEFSRASLDAVAALKSTMAGHAIEVDVKGLNQVVDLKQQALNMKVQMADTFKDLGLGIHNMAISTEAEIEAATGKFSAAFNKEVDTSLANLTTKYQTTLAALVPTAAPDTGTGTGTGAGGDKGSGAIGTGTAVGSLLDGLVSLQQGIQGLFPGFVNKHARGTVFDTRGGTSMTVGEAGNEHVAVLRNPRRVPMGAMFGGGGGGTSVNVNISGDWRVRETSDVDAVAERIARRVEDRLNRRAAIFATNQS